MVSVVAQREIKEWVTNRKNQRIALIVDKPQSPQGLTFITHGLGGFKEQPQIIAFADAFHEGGYTTLRFDTTNTLEESEGNYEDATITGYYQDLEDVIQWAKSRPWYREPFCLTGHSLGSFCVAWYAQHYPEKVKAIAPISVVISGKLFLESLPQEQLKEWKSSGWLVEESQSRPGVIKRLKWGFIEDALKYDLLARANKLTMPTLMIVGENDRTTPPEHQKLLFDRLPGRKEIHVIQGAEHTFRDQKHLEEIKQLMMRWIESF